MLEPDVPDLRSTRGPVLWGAHVHILTTVCSEPRISQEVTERFYNLLAVGESHSPDGREADARLRIRAIEDARVPASRPP
jgi:hypothetical protein